MSKTYKIAKTRNLTSIWHHKRIRKVFVKHKHIFWMSYYNTTDYLARKKICRRSPNKTVQVCFYLKVNEKALTFSNTISKPALTIRLYPWCRGIISRRISVACKIYVFKSYHHLLATIIYKFEPLVNKKAFRANTNLLSKTLKGGLFSMIDQQTVSLFD